MGYPPWVWVYPGSKNGHRYSYSYLHHRYGLLTGTGPGTAKNSWAIPVQITNHRGVRDQGQVLELHRMHLVIPSPFQPCTCLCMRHLMTIEDLDH